MGKLRFGIIGAGNIADVVARTLSEMEEVDAYAISARDLSRAKALAEKHGFAAAYGSYDEMLRDEKVDVVYVGTTNAHHFDHAKAALLHGKHVICEKAFTLNEAQAKELCELAKSRGLFLMEALWTRFMPFVPKLKELIDSGAIGEASSLTAAFGVYRPQNERLYKAELGGGALLDVGLYPITFAMLAFGEDIEHIDSAAILNDEGVDLQNAVVFRYRDGKMAVIHSSVAADLSNQAVICGTKGRIVIDRFWYAERILVYRDGETGSQVYGFPFEINGYEYEMRAAIEDIAAGRLENATMPHAETLRMMRLYDNLRREWGVVYPQER